MNFAMPSCLASHLICELYHAIIFYYVLNLSTILVHSTALRVHQPFDTVMANSGVKTRASEQTMLSDEVRISLVTDSSSEEDSDTDDQSYSPLIRLQCIYIFLLFHAIILPVLDV